MLPHCVGAMRARVGIPITVKTRLGIDDRQQVTRLLGKPRSRHSGAVLRRCRAELPALTEPVPGHRVACWETARVLEAAACDLRLVSTRFGALPDLLEGNQRFLVALAAGEIDLVV